MDNVQLPENPEIARGVLDNQMKGRQLGWLGKVFGSNANTSTHIVGLLLVLLVIAGVGYTFFAPSGGAFPAGEFWKVLSPIITTLVGYLLGAGSRPNASL